MLKKSNPLISNIIKNFKKNPNKKIIFDNERSLTYSELIYSALATSKKIKKLDSEYIPIIIDRNVESVVAILAVLFSKKTFCPISHKFPIDRIKNFLKIIKTNHVINCSKKKFNVHNEHKIIFKFKETKLDFDLKNSDDTFYLLFTSGTTGDPKGVKLSFNNIYNTLKWSRNYLNWNNHKIGIATEFSFDISMFDLFSGLYFNVPMYIFQNPSNPILSLGEIKKNKITSIFSVPTFFSNFVRYNLISKNFFALKRIISGGDFFLNKDILSWKVNQPKVEIFNVWGPTETSIVNTMYKVSKKDLKNLADGKSIPVGRSHKLMEVKILRNKKEVKNGLEGEICMIGKCVSLGYLGSNKNSKNYFKHNRRNAYLTGDLGYLDNKKNLHIIGRKDNTIKISGYRVDALEVENLVNTNFNLNNSCLIKQTIMDIDILCLAIEANKRIKTENIINFLKNKIPAYALPKKIIIFKKFPLNQNSKVDRNKIKLYINGK